MPIISNADVEFSPGSVENTMRRVLVNPDRGSGAITLGEMIMDPGSELPTHTHRVEEAMVITKGIATAFKLFKNISPKGFIYFIVMIVGIPNFILAIA